MLIKKVSVGPAYYHKWNATRDNYLFSHDTKIVPTKLFRNSNNEITSIKGELNSNQNLNTDSYGLVSGSDVMSLFKDFRWSLLNIIPRVSTEQEYLWILFLVLAAKVLGHILINFGVLYSAYLTIPKGSLVKFLILVKPLNLWKL